MHDDSLNTIKEMHGDSLNTFREMHDDSLDTFKRKWFQNSREKFLILIAF